MGTHSGCWYCGGRNKGDAPLKSLIKITIEPDGSKNHGHTMGFGLCDVHADAPFLDLRVPKEGRRSA